MFEPVLTTQNTKAPDLRDLCAFLGMALVTWQKVEDTHYLLFVKLIGAPKKEVCSILYFSPPSFESRRVLVDRLAQTIITDPKILKTWRKLNKDLDTEGSNRGKLAHYGLDYEVVFNTPEPSTDFKLGFPKLAPSRHNQIASLVGKKKTKEPLTTKEVRNLITNFIEIEGRLNEFIQSFHLPEPQQGANLLQGLAPYFSSLAGSPPSPPSKPQPDGQSSAK
jgi:hypothetical protein